MLQLAGNLCLAHKSLARLVALCQRWLQLFDGDLTIQLRIDRPHYQADAAARQQLYDAKPSNRTAVWCAIRRGSNFDLARCAWRLVQQIIKLELTLKLSAPLRKSRKKLLTCCRLAHCQ